MRTVNAFAAPRWTRLGSFQRFICMLTYVVDLNDAFASDGEEFADDVILQDLRRRRAGYLTLLLQLDEAILTRTGS